MCCLRFKKNKNKKNRIKSLSNSFEFKISNFSSFRSIIDIIFVVSDTETQKRSREDDKSDVHIIVY